MRKTLITGLTFALIAAFMVLFGGSLGMSLSPFALLGLAIGAALGLIPIGSPGLRAAAWAIGFGAAVLGYGLWLSVLPDTGSGRAISTFLVVLGLVLVAALSGGALPLWAQLLGAASVIGAYRVDPTAPTAFTATSVGGVTTVALGAALGFLMTSVTEQLPGRGLQADFGWNGGGVVSGLPQPRQAEPAGLAGPIGATNIPTGSTGTATGSAGIPTGSASIPTGPTGVPIINQLKSGA